ncbi:MAG: hypothetical protein QGI24_09535 [Kiritimatiellia bacterium]|jgi:hypothetical protein|nr:hypothetical protein [Kiritimatiellia bacterium]MDP6849017.1 hypothetical protein [Kiritimatiellia bacterium]
MNLANGNVRCVIVLVFAWSAMCFSAQGETVSVVEKPDAPPAAEPVAEPAAEPAAEPVAEPAAEEPVAEEPAAGPVAQPVKEVVGTRKDLEFVDEQIGSAMACTNDVIQAVKMVSAQDKAIKTTLQSVSNLFTYTTRPTPVAGGTVTRPEPAPPVAVPVTEPAAEPVARTVVKGEGPVAEGMEATGYWRRESWADKGSASVQGGLLVVETVPGKHGKTAATRSFEDPLVIDPKDSVTVDVENRGASSIQVALALFKGYAYYETPTQNVKPGTRSLTYKMSAKTFKSAATQWMQKGSLEGPLAVDKLTLLIYSEKPAEAAFDNLLLGRGGN